MPESPRQAYRHGNRPELFWDARKDELIDVTEPVTLARILTRANARVAGMLVPREVLEARLEQLPIPEHSKLFWRLVIARLPRRDSPDTDGEPGTHPGAL